MPTTLGWVYIVGVTVLFFFWAYGLVSFVQDLRNYVVPWLRQRLAERREAGEAAERERERTEQERQLY